MTTRKLHEAGTLAKPEKKGVFPIRLIREGKGSSGSYTKELLTQYAEAFNNSPMFLDHPSDPSRPDKRSVKDIAAKFIEPVEYRVNESDGLGELWTKAKVDSRWVEFMEDYSEFIGVSIFIEGAGKENENGEFIVESFNGNDPYKSCDFVVAAGAGGKVERMLESYRAIETSVGAPADNGPALAEADELKKRQNMDELKALIEALTSNVNEKFVALEAKVDSVVTLSESATDAATAKVEALEVADKLAEAKLTESGRKRVLESVKTGALIADAIKAEATLRDEFLAESKVVQTGRVVESASADDDFSIGAWK